MHKYSSPLGVTQVSTSMCTIMANVQNYTATQSYTNPQAEILKGAYNIDCSLGCYKPCIKSIKEDKTGDYFSGN